MTDIEQKARELVNKVLNERGMAGRSCIDRDIYAHEALCRAIEQHEAAKQELSDYKQEVSDAVGDTLFMVETHCDGEAVALVSNCLVHFIIPAPKPDPLEEIIGELDDGTWGETKAEYADRIRAALDALGLEIREKNDD